MQVNVERASMKYVVGFMTASCLWILMFIVLSSIEVPEYKVYDCGIAEWHPDIPREVKEECRKINRKKSIGV